MQVYLHIVDEARDDGRFATIEPANASIEHYFRQKFNFVKLHESQKACSQNEVALKNYRKAIADRKVFRKAFVL